MEKEINVSQWKDAEWKKAYDRTRDFCDKVSRLESQVKEYNGKGFLARLLSSRPKVDNEALKKEADALGDYAKAFNEEYGEGARKTLPDGSTYKITMFRSTRDVRENPKIRFSWSDGASSTMLTLEIGKDGQLKDLPVPYPDSELCARGRMRCDADSPLMKAYCKFDRMTAVAQAVIGGNTSQIEAISKAEAQRNERQKDLLNGEMKEMRDSREFEDNVEGNSIEDLDMFTANRLATYALEHGISAENVKAVLSQQGADFKDAAKCVDNVFEQYEKFVEAIPRTEYSAQKEEMAYQNEVDRQFAELKAALDRKYPDSFYDDMSITEGEGFKKYVEENAEAIGYKSDKEKLRYYLNDLKVEIALFAYGEGGLHPEVLDKLQRELYSSTKFDVLKTEGKFYLDIKEKMKSLSGGRSHLDLSDTGAVVRCPKGAPAKFILATGLSLEMGNLTLHGIDSNGRRRLVPISNKIWQPSNGNSISISHLPELLLRKSEKAASAIGMSQQELQSFGKKYDLSDTQMKELATRGRTTVDGLLTMTTIGGVEFKRKIFADLKYDSATRTISAVDPLSGRSYGTLESLMRSSSHDLDSRKTKQAVGLDESQSNGIRR